MLISEKPSNQHPGYTRCTVVQDLSIPSLPDLVSQFLINQQSFYLDFGEHGTI